VFDSLDCPATQDELEHGYHVWYCRCYPEQPCGRDACRDAINSVPGNPDTVWKMAAWDRGYIHHLYSIEASEQTAEEQAAMEMDSMFATEI